MDHKLIITIPDDIYKPLAESAERTGLTAEALAVEWLATAAQNAVEDPLEEFIGAFKSDVPGWADEHDKHLGQALLDEMCDKGA